jgi:hypothetical protein
MPFALWVAAPLIVHGLAHLSGCAACWTSRGLGFADRPWVFSHQGSLHTPVGRAFGLLWLSSAVLLVGSGLALLAGSGAWPPLALAGACVSLAAIVPWWRTVPPGARVGVVFDLLIVYAVLQHLLDWVPGAAG